MKCLCCSSEIHPYNWKYCSIACRNKEISKIPRRNYKRVHMVCKNCGEHYIVVNSRKDKSSYCSKECQGLALGKGMQERRRKKEKENVISN